MQKCLPAGLSNDIKTQNSYLKDIIRSATADK